MTRIKDVFGTMVFDKKAMKEKLPRDVYFRLMDHMETGDEITKEMADVIASAVADWAQERGATHYTHWFQPMTGVTAEKHDSFLDFSGKALIKGEPDASSFPSGGVRATFEARGYTAWDPSSYMFIKEDTLCIPTVFLSYSGEALDKKTPLLRSAQALDKQAKRVLDAIDRHSEKVISTIGSEQEYFLIPKELYGRRKDLVFTGRTLVGAKPPKTQEMDDHYFGVLKTKVKSYMADLDVELWKMGILANTEHNEVAPSQHEMAPIFKDANTAADHNQLTMEMMKKTAEKHGLRCLLHEKPFDGINGSGKHVNWSLATKEGENLLMPGRAPLENDSFLLFVTAVIKAVDMYQDLLRISVGSAGNDHRLGGSEAPPAIISIFMGEDITDVLDSLEKGETLPERKNLKMDMGITVLPDFKKDTSDRNRTSPFAFSGSRFEFRMVGSRAAVSCPGYMINTMVADVLAGFADELEAGSEPKEVAAKAYGEHKRIVFNGDNYTDEWIAEAGKRGLLNLKTTPEAAELFDDEKNVSLFERQGVLTECEIRARKEIIVEEYDKTVNIEALTMIDMMEREIIPAVMEYEKELAEKMLLWKETVPEMGTPIAKSLLVKASVSLDRLQDGINELKEAADGKKQLEIMEKVRAASDELEKILPENKWPIPTYGDLLFS
ncbi:MAG: glutamine synthetase III [Eubacteriaceae bacterium]|nr:glutamine synthetase III [Eubacteriaceae bacterium]